MRIVFLGTSGCVPTEERNLSSIFLEYLGECFLFDCGEGTQRQMRRAGLNFMRIDNVFITHLHADHFLGLGGMIQSMDFMERARDLNIYGPVGMKDTINHMLSMGTFVLDHLKVKVHEIELKGDETLVLDGERYVIKCAKAEHTSNSIAYCFEEKPHRKFLKKKALDLGVPEGPLFSRLQNGEEVKLKDGIVIMPDEVLSQPVSGRKIVYTGDTRACDSILKFAKDADILIHDSTFSQDEEESLKDAAHSTARQAAELALKAGVRRLYLTHISQRYTESEKLQQEAGEVFPESYVAEDLMEVKVERH